MKIALVLNQLEGLAEALFTLSSGVDEKYQSLELSNTALFIDYLLVLAKNHRTLFEKNNVTLIATMIKPLLASKDGAEFSINLSKIGALFGSYALLPDFSSINYPCNDITFHELAAAIREPHGLGKASLWMNAILSECEPLDDYHMGFAMANVKKKTLGMYYKNEFLPETKKKLKHFLQCVSTSSFNIATILTMEEALEAFLDNRVLVSLDCKDNVPELLQQALIECVAEENIELIHFYKLKAFCDLLEEKSQGSLSTTGNKYESLKFYLDGPGRLLDLIEDKLRKLHAVDQLDSLYLFQLEANLLPEMFEKMKLNELSVMIREFFPVGSIGNTFKATALNYVIYHSEEIMRKQKQFTKEEKANSIYDKFFAPSGPKTYGEYMVQEVGLANAWNVTKRLSESQRTEKDAEFRGKILPLLEKKKRNEAWKMAVKEMIDNEGDFNQQFYSHYLDLVKSLIELNSWPVHPKESCETVNINDWKVQMPILMAKLYKNCLTRKTPNDNKKHFERHCAMITFAQALPSITSVHLLRVVDKLPSSLVNKAVEAYTNHKHNRV